MKLIFSEKELQDSKKKKITSKCSIKLLNYLRTIADKLNKGKISNITEYSKILNLIYLIIYNSRAADYLKFSTIETIRFKIIEEKFFQKQEISKLPKDQIDSLILSQIKEES